MGAGDAGPHCRILGIDFSATFNFSRHFLGTELADRCPCRSRWNNQPQIGASP